MIVKHTLSNGVRIVAEQIPHVRSVSVGLWVGTGSRFESHDNNGISHFLEHMFFKGTKCRTARQLAEAFDEIGGEVNAFTSKELTCYYAKVLSEHFHVAIDILADMFFESCFASEEIAKEKKVITEEIRMVEDTPDDIVHDLLAKATYGQHPLGFPVLGSVDNVLRFEREQLFSYYEKMYRPDNLVIAIAGNIPEDYIQILEKYFQSFHRAPVENKIDPPTFSSQEIVRQKATEQIHICIGFPGASLTDEQFYAYILLNNVIGGNMSSRLFQEVREERGLAYSVYSYHTARRDCGLFTIYAGTSPEQANDVITVIAEVINEIREKGMTKEELSKAKEQLKASLLMGLESTGSRMSRLGKNELLIGEHPSLDELVERIESVSLEDTQLAAQSIFSGKSSLALISPDDRLPSAYRRDLFA